MDVKCSVFIAASVDGFIARPDGDVSWLDAAEYASDDPPGLSYPEYIATVDALVMGRHTFEKALTFGFWPYEGTPVVVLSRRGVDVPQKLRRDVQVQSESPGEVVRRLGEVGHRHLYVDGGRTIQGFLRAGLIDEITVTWIPVLLGEGIPLFGTLEVERPLEHLETVSGSNGFVQCRYWVARRVERRNPDPIPR